MPNEESGVNQATPPVAEQDVTKIVSKRINEIREKDRTELAKAMGYDSWDDAMNSGLDKKLLDSGIDPAVGKPIIDSAVSNHPDVLKAKALIAEAEKAKANAELQALNTKYGLSIASMDDIDAETKEYVSKGIPLEKAYLVTHYDTLQNAHGTNTETAKAVNNQSLSHITTIPGASASAAKVTVVSQADIANVHKYLPGATEDQIKKFLEAHPELKP